MSHSENRIDLSFISSAGLVGRNLCVNIVTLNVRGEEGRSEEEPAGGRPKNQQTFGAWHGKARLQWDFSTGGEAGSLQG